LWNLAVFLLAIFVGGGLLAPWVWWGVQAFAGAGSEGWGRGLADHPFYRYVHRCLLAVALLGLVPFLRGMGVGSWRSMGLGKPEGGTGNRGRHWLTGFAIGAGMFALALGVEVATGLRVWRPDQGVPRIAWVLVSAFGAALVVGMLEEPLFRGALFRGLGEAVGWPVALAVSSLIYGWVHFLGKVPSPDPVTWDAGLKVVASMVRMSLDVRVWLPGMPTLVLAGILLGSDRSAFGLGFLHQSPGRADGVGRGPGGWERRMGMGGIKGVGRLDGVGGGGGGGDGFRVAGQPCGRPSAGPSLRAGFRWATGASSAGMTSGWRGSILGEIRGRQGWTSLTWIC
jgi:membrane protease YdiL (CAAX protease family)